MPAQLRKASFHLVSASLRESTHCAQDDNFNRRSSNTCRRSLQAYCPGDLRSPPSTFLYICGKITAERVTVTLESD